MSESSKKGPLIKKKTRSNGLERPRPVVINTQNDFKFNNTLSNPITPADEEPAVAEKTVPTAVVENKLEAPVPETVGKQNRKKKSVVGKSNNVKSIKVPYDLHIQIGVLGKFMDENKTYAIISELVEYYTKNELTDRQQKQFEYMTDFFNEDDE
ncbi:hypothetical protein ACQKDD_14250 [Planococcus kocurii]|uniref:hypothetical protein n=1 Tax=Planococcus kocurii TaxID=1374 RepID=UPI003CFF0D4A